MYGYRSWISNNKKNQNKDIMFLLLTGHNHRFKGLIIYYKKFGPDWFSCVFIYVYISSTKD